MAGGTTNSTRSVIDHTNNLIIDNFPVVTSPQFNTNSNIDENNYVFDGVKVEIEDIDNTSLSNLTTQSLKRCKQHVLKHYYRLLCFIGWRPFCKEYFYNMPIYCSFFNLLYPIIILLLLLYCYICEILIDSGTLDQLYGRKLNITEGMKNPLLGSGGPKTGTSTANTTKSPNHLIKTENKLKKDLHQIIMGYILPSVLHLTAYIMGFIYFRIHENEQLYALMEKVFLSVNQTIKQVSQDKVIRRLKIFIIFGILWMLGSLGLNIYLSIDRLQYYYEMWPLIAFQMLGLILIYAVYLAVIINHGTQCEMIIFHVQEIRTRLEEKSITIKDAMQQILDSRVSIGNLNSTISKMTTIIDLIFMEKICNGIITLVIPSPPNKLYVSKEIIIWFLCLFLWTSVLLFSVIQVARLNSACDRFKQIAISARVYGYHASTRDELDSFLLFISNAGLRGKLCGISLKSNHLLAILIIVMFFIVLTIQTSFLKF